MKPKAIELKDDHLDYFKLKAVRSQLLGGETIFFYVSPAAHVQVESDIHGVKEFAEKLLELVAEIEAERAKYF